MHDLIRNPARDMALNAVRVEDRLNLLRKRHWRVHRRHHLGLTVSAERRADDGGAGRG